MRNLVSKTLLSISLFGLSALSFAAGDPKNGESIADAECVACHGPQGNSVASTFPKLAGLGEKYLYKQLLDIQNAGDSGDPKKPSRKINEMIGMLDNKSDQQLQDLSAYYASQAITLAGAEKIQVQVNSGEKVDGLELGARLYRAGNFETGVPACAGCHSPRGLGNAPAAYPRVSGQYADYVAKQLKDFRAGNRTNDSEMVMRQIAEHMTDAEITAVANFIAGLN